MDLGFPGAIEGEFDVSKPWICRRTLYMLCTLEDSNVEILSLSEKPNRTPRRASKYNPRDQTAADLHLNYCNRIPQTSCIT